MMSCTDLTVVVLGIFCFATASVNSQGTLGLEEDQVCKKEGGEQWRCTTASKCNHVDFRHNRPPICSFKGKNPIICCPPPKIRIAEKRCSQFTTASCDAQSLQLVSGQVLLSAAVGGVDAKPRVHRGMNALKSKLRRFLFNNHRFQDSRGIVLRGIIGGIKTRPKCQRTMALLGYGKSKNQVQWNCGGSLISDRYVLSAAHCTSSPIGKPKWARVGELDLSSNTEDARPEDRQIIQWINHPGYKPPSLYNDIAIYKLDRSIKFNAWVAPLCLHTKSDIPVNKATVIGFGRLEFAGELSPTLQEVEISLVNSSDCKKSYGAKNSQQIPRGIEPASMICAGEKEGGKDACSGDSGGPMVIDIPGTCLKKLIGVTSFGRDCGLPNTPGIYTRVSHYLDWIEQIVWPSA